MTTIPMPDLYGHDILRLVERVERLCRFPRPQAIRLDASHSHFNDAITLVGEIDDRRLSHLVDAAVARRGGASFLEDAMDLFAEEVANLADRMLDEAIDFAWDHAKLAC